MYLLQQIHKIAVVGATPGNKWNLTGNYTTVHDKIIIILFYMIFLRLLIRFSSREV